MQSALCLYHMAIETVKMKLKYESSYLQMKSAIKDQQNGTLSLQAFPDISRKIHFGSLHRKYPGPL